MLLPITDPVPHSYEDPDAANPPAADKTTVLPGHDAVVAPVIEVGEVDI